MTLWAPSSRSAMPAACVEPRRRFAEFDWHASDKNPQWVGLCVFQPGWLCPSFLSAQSPGAAGRASWQRSRVASTDRRHHLGTPSSGRWLSGRFVVRMTSLIGLPHTLRFANLPSSLGDRPTRRPRAAMPTNSASTRPTSSRWGRGVPTSCGIRARRTLS